LRHRVSKAKCGQMSTPARLDRAFITVTGPDAVSFLDNLLTQNVTGIHDAGVRYAALLTPQGKVIADMMLWPTQSGVVIEADPARAVDLLRRLTMYKLRAQVQVSDTSSAHMALWSAAPFADAAPDPRLAALGFRKLSARDEAPSGDSAYNALRIRQGVPDLATDATPDEVFAGEALLDELNGVDFQKGCFVGQENVSRMKRRATTRKKFCPIAFEGAAPAFGAVVRAGEAELGTVRSGVDGRALALLRLDRALAAETPLSVDGREIRLDPPSWLILPQRDGAPG